MQVEVIMLKEVSQTQKDKSCMISFICASHTKNDKCHNSMFVHVQIYIFIYLFTYLCICILYRYIDV
jgi:hypothetical protein